MYKRTQQRGDSSTWKVEGVGGSLVLQGPGRREVGRFGEMEKFLSSSFKFLNKCEPEPLAMKADWGVGRVKKMGGGVKWFWGGQKLKPDRKTQLEQSVKCSELICGLWS